MFTKTHKTAVVLIPPKTAWEPIQAIRQRHDRQYRRWLPHITLLYPFRTSAEFDLATPALVRVCAKIQPFLLSCAQVDAFHHGRERYTLWLAPEPSAPLCQLHAALVAGVPGFTAVQRHAKGFTPHLSIAQVNGRTRMERLREQLQAEWPGLTFFAKAISLIWRNDPPDDVFRVAEVIALGETRAPAEEN